MSKRAEELALNLCADLVNRPEHDMSIALSIIEQYGRECLEAAVIHLQNKISACDIDFPIGNAVAQSCVNEIRNLPLP